MLGKTIYIAKSDKPTTVKIILFIFLCNIITQLELNKADNFFFVFFYKKSINELFFIFYYLKLK